MQTVKYNLGKTDETITQVTKINFDHTRNEAEIHSTKSGSHTIPVHNIISID